MTDENPTDDDVPVDTVLKVLSDERRRVVLDRLLRRGGPVEVEELVDRIVDERGLADDARSDDLRLEVTLSLHHLHLPKIADAGLAEYDPARQVVEPTDAVRIVEPYLEFLRSDDSG